MRKFWGGSKRTSSTFVSPQRRVVVTGYVDEGAQVTVRSVAWELDSHNLFQRELDANWG